MKPLPPLIMPNHNIKLPRNRILCIQCRGHLIPELLATIIVIIKKRKTKTIPMEMLAANGLWAWDTNNPIGMIQPSHVIAWERVPKKELPLYISWKYVWPALAQTIKDA